jgi:hypothetical protein
MSGVSAGFWLLDAGLGFRQSDRSTGIRFKFNSFCAGDIDGF